MQAPTYLKWVCMKRLAMTTLLAAAAAAAVTGCNASEQGSPAATRGPASPRSESPQSPSPQDGTGQVGDKFTFENGNSRYEVTLLGVEQQAKPDSEYASVQAGHHLAAAQFRVAAVSGSVDENANNSATVTGTNEQAYTSSVSGIAAGTNFASGSIRLQPGNSLLGWVSFELPNGVQVAKVQWAPNQGLSPHAEEWKVSGSTAATPTGTASPSPTTTSPSPGATSPSPGATSPSPGAAAPGQGTSSKEVVIAYFDAINARNFQKAWELGGKNTASSVDSFSRGYDTTAMVSVDVLDVSGDSGSGVVTARINAVQTDGSTAVFQGTYTVKNGVIAKFNVRRVS